MTLGLVPQFVKISLFIGLMLLSTSLAVIFPLNPVAGLSSGVTKTVLDNGLTVLIKEIPTAPVVSLQVWYRVGSRHEPKGENGIAHQLEHLMFKGTKSRPVQFGQLFYALGSSSNAFTSYDMTAYHHTVRADQLEPLLILEADRLRNTLMTPDALESEKRVVISELQGYENSPEYRLSRAVMAALYPHHPYGLPVGGTASDVEQFTLPAVNSFYHQYYRPDNAVVVIAGDVRPPRALELVKKTFGQIPRPTDPLKSPSLPPPTAGQAQRIRLTEPGSAPLLQILVPIPAMAHPDQAALDVLDMLLSGGRSSYLYQELMETGQASSAYSYVAALQAGGWFEIGAIAAPEQSLETIEQTIHQILNQLAERPLSAAELQRAKQQLKANFILRNRDIDAQASQLANDETLTGDYRFSDRHLAAIEKVTAADVQRVVQTYFGRDRWIVGEFIPSEFADVELSGRPGAQTTAHNLVGEPVDPQTIAAYLPQGSGQAAPEVKSNGVETFTLKNGLRVLLLVDRSTPTITLAGRIDAGTAYDLLTQPGVANLTAANLLNGTRRKNALTLAQTLEDRGISLEFSAFRDGVDIEGYALASELPTLLQTLGEVLQEATFPESEFQLSRQRYLTALSLEADDPVRWGRRVLQETLYPANHPLHPFATPESVQAIQRPDLLNFYRAAYTPDHTILTLVGDFDPVEVRSRLNEIFGSWQPQTDPLSLTFPAVSPPEQTLFKNAVIAGKSQAITYLGTPGIDRRDPRFYAAMLMNHILGGDTLASRLGTEIRDRQGLTYGIYSFFSASRQAGPFIIQLQTAPEDTAKAIQATLQLLRDAHRQGFTAAELGAAKRSLSNTYLVELANVDVVARTLVGNASVDLPPEELQQFSDRLQQVTLDEVNHTLRDLIDPERLVIVTAGPSVSFSP
ncbi:MULTISPECIES: pitrilysin family protein [unclassified Thermosynechococcus]|uniref:M16 family metallopeptidase n=1 Tax=unclassified Thermosynechococcus TaxID=2622553 RepID=UPI002877CF1B|nr:MULTISPECIES: pitrilysin family protein [unclassified Thermosynechococcus]WNC52248.1 pitrilysin family protein [Thermosynechococcus sp. TG215]WNC57333.1 pitrilysin family protein [Thermosynechococcus sp. TG218]